MLVRTALAALIHLKISYLPRKKEDRSTHKELEIWLHFSTSAVAAPLSIAFSATFICSVTLSTKVFSESFLVVEKTVFRFLFVSSTNNIILEATYMRCQRQNLKIIGFPNRIFFCYRRNIIDIIVLIFVRSFKQFSNQHL